MLLDIEEVAALLNVKPTVVHRLAKQGTIPGRKVGGQWRFHPANIGCFMFAADPRTVPVGL